VDGNGNKHNFFDVTSSYLIPDRSMWNLIELFTNLDLAQLSYISEGEAETSLNIPPWDPAIPLASISTSASCSFLVISECQFLSSSRRQDCKWCN